MAEEHDPIKDVLCRVTEKPSALTFLHINTNNFALEDNIQNYFVLSHLKYCQSMPCFQWIDLVLAFVKWNMWDHALG